MIENPNISLRRSKQTGVWICMGALVAGGLFLVGLFQQSYWALAIPVGMGVLTVLLLAFWIGFTINTIDRIPAEAEQYHDGGARRIALLICAGCVLLAVVFLAAVLQGSYLALAIPVALAVLGLLGMVFWIGWAIHTQSSTLPEEAGEGEDAASRDAVL
ncbi:MAG: hypothetical protein O6934_10775 [SAR324 cluster bacterium]|nr:hypothetical protein [SAR324 cluster bacterium]